MLKEPIAISHQGNGTEGRTVTLRPSPRPVEPGSIDQELRLSQSETLWQESTRGVGDSLENGLGMDIIVDHGLEGRISEDELVNQHFQS